MYSYQVVIKLLNGSDNTLEIYKQFAMAVENFKEISDIVSQELGTDKFIIMSTSLMEDTKILTKEMK